MAHHKATAHAEAEKARGQALQRMLYRAFDDPFDNAGAASANSNPIGKNTRLRQTNPLLGSDSD